MNALAAPFLGHPVRTAVGCAVFATLAWFAWPDPDDGEVLIEDPAAATAAAPASAARAAASRPGGLDGRELPPDPARMFDLGAAGDLRIDMETKAALDMIVADLGNPPSAEGLAAVERSLRAGLPAEAANQAFAMVQSYVSYSQAVVKTAALQKPPESPEEMRQLLAQDAALRRQFFDPATARALFGTQEAHSQYMLDAQAIESNVSLGAVEKARQLHALRSALPDDVVELEPSLSPKASEMNLRIAMLREQGGSEAQVQALRTQYLGPDAASSIGEMEAQNTAWADRHDSFRKAREALLATHPSDPRAAVEQLMAQHFSPEELPGAKAYDQQRR